jgi:hypothetical protein
MRRLLCLYFGHRLPLFPSRHDHCERCGEPCWEAIHDAVFGAWDSNSTDG